MTAIFLDRGEWTADFTVIGRALSHRRYHDHACPACGAETVDVNGWSRCTFQNQQTPMHPAPEPVEYQLRGDTFVYRYVR